MQEENDNKQEYRMISEKNLIDLMKCFASKSEFDALVGSIKCFSNAVNKSRYMSLHMKLNDKQDNMINASIVIFLANIISDYMEIWSDVLRIIKVDVVTPKEYEDAVKYQDEMLERVLDDNSDFNIMINKLKEMDKMFEGDD